MYTSFGKQVDRVYRLHITCPAKHTTYTDYATNRAAKRNLARMTDKTDWYATHIEVVTHEMEVLKWENYKKEYGIDS